MTVPPTGPDRPDEPNPISTPAVPEPSASDVDPFGTAIRGVVPPSPVGPAGAHPTPVPDTVPTDASSTPRTGRRRHRWVWPVAAAGAFVLGIGIGAAGGGADPTRSDEYQALAAERDELRDAVDSASTRADEAEESAEAAVDALRDRAAQLDDREAALEDRTNDLDDRQADLEAREAAVAGAEAVVAATQIGIGTWTVGVDVEPGTYRTAEAVSSSCYWGIYRSGTNKADIIDNDIVQGGFPTVTLSTGQDFENGCGVWNKQ